jgi:hypothetical protein
LSFHLWILVVKPMIFHIVSSTQIGFSGDLTTPDCGLPETF